MHEFSRTSQIVEAVLGEATKHNASKVIEVELEIGDLTFLSLEQVRFLYKVLTENTIAKDSKLSIKQVHGRGKCSSCGYDGPLKYLDDPQFHITFPTFNCPRCSAPLQVSAGRECVLKRIRMEKP